MGAPGSELLSVDVGAGDGVSDAGAEPAVGEVLGVGPPSDDVPCSFADEPLPLSGDAGCAGGPAAAGLEVLAGGGPFE